MNDFFNTKYNNNFLLWILDTEGKSKSLFLMVLEVFVNEN